MSRVKDSEIAALLAIIRALNKLDDAAQARIMRWAWARYMESGKEAGE